MKAAIYVRVSTSGQAINGESLDMQKESLIEYINAHGWELFKTYEDGGFSGGSSNRPAFQEMLSDVKQKKFDILLVYKIDRLSRSILDFHNTMKLLEQNNVSFVSLTQQFDTSTSTGRLMLAILVDFANFEREINSDRAKDSYLGRLKHGVHSGMLPIGYKKIDDKVIVDPVEAETVKEIFDLGLKGFSSAKIADKTGLNIDHVKSIITNPFYAGFVCPKKGGHGKRIQNYAEWHKGQQEAIIPYETYKRVQELRSRPGNSKHFALFSKMLYCPKCGHNLTARYRKYRTGNVTTFYKCLPIRKNDKSCNISIREEDLENILITNIDKVFTLKISSQRNKASIQDRVKRIDAKIAKALDLIDIDSITAADIRKRIEELRKEKENLLAEQPTLDYMKLAKSISKAKDIYQYANPEEKKTLWVTLIKNIVVYKNFLEVHWIDSSIAKFKCNEYRFGGAEGD